jgi:hypothetical protein
MKKNLKSKKPDQSRRVKKDAKKKSNSFLIVVNKHSSSSSSSFYSDDKRQRDSSTSSYDSEIERLKKKRRRRINKTPEYDSDATVKNENDIKSKEENVEKISNNLENNIGIISDSKFEGIELRSKVLNEANQQIDLFSNFKKMNVTDITNAHRKM